MCLNFKFRRSIGERQRFRLDSELTALHAQTVCASKLIISIEGIEA
jgi:hypothetical protein